MTDKQKKLISHILLERSFMFILVIAYFSIAILFNPKGETDSIIPYKHAMAVMIQNIAPYGILIECKAILDVLLDFIFRFSTIEKTMIIGTCGYGAGSKGHHEYLYRSIGFFYYIERALDITNIYEAIWLDKRLTDFDCEPAHTYRIKMLRFRMQ